MKTVISISLGSTSQDFSFTTRLLGQTLRVRRLGTDGSLAQASRLLRQWDGKADAIGLGVVKDSGRLRAQTLGDAQVARLKAVPRKTPVSTGSRLREVLLEWAVATPRPNWATTSTTPACCSSRASRTTSWRWRCGKTPPT